MATTLTKVRKTSLASRNACRFGGSVWLIGKIFRLDGTVDSNRDAKPPYNDRGHAAEYKRDRPEEQSDRANLAVLAFVRHHLLAAQSRWPRRLLHCTHIGPLPRSQVHCHRPAMTIQPRPQLGVEPAFGATDRLILLAHGGVAGVLMNLDAAGIQEAQGAGGTTCKHHQHLSPQPTLAPTAPACVTRTPRAEETGQIPPRMAGAQHIQHGLDHQAMIFGRASTPPSQRERYRKSRSLS